jgi:hypothetical protein
MYDAKSRGKTAVRITPRSNYFMADNKYKLGKYYTPPDVIDLILALCVKKPSDRILDPACGPGGFLKEALSRLSFLSKMGPNVDLSEQIWGVELDPKAAEMARNDLAKMLRAYNGDSIHVLNRDFFDIHSSRTAKATLESWREDDTLPSMDAVVGNPPYTRQEELTFSPFGSDYKDKLHRVVSREYPDLTVSRMAGIYVYFLIHAASFLPPNKGRLGFVTLRSWMDTRFGAVLRNFLTRHFKIVLIIESDAEKWFTEAQMLPCIIVAETCESKQNRDSNLVKIIRLKRNLSSYWSVKTNSNSHNWESIGSFASFVENAENSIDFSEVDFLEKKILIHNSSLHRMLAIEQKSLSEDSKWGKYLVAPTTFFKILEHAAGLLTPLSNAAAICRGITTGANDFFLFPNRYFEMEEGQGYLILTEKKERKRKFQIESEYVQPVLRSRRRHASIRLRTSDGFILIANATKEDLRAGKKKVLDYIEYGESAKVRLRRGLKDAGQHVIGFNHLPTTNSRKIWFSLTDRNPAPIIFPNIFWGGYVGFYNDIGLKPVNSFYEIFPKEGVDPKVLCALLNSTLSALFTEFSGRYIENRDGTRSNQIMMYELSKLPIIDPKRIHSYDSALEKVFDNILNTDPGPTSYSRTSDEIRKLDKIIFCDILGFSEQEMESIRGDLREIISQRLRNSSQRFLNAQCI